MYADHLQVVKQSLADARERCHLSVLAADMFREFFERHPEARDIFVPFDLEKIGPFKFCKIADALVDVLEYPEYSETSLSEEVYRHQIYDIKDKEYYFALVDAFVHAIKRCLGDDWSTEYDECWNDAVSGLQHNVVLGLQEHIG